MKQLAYLSIIVLCFSSSVTFSQTKEEIIQIQDSTNVGQLMEYSRKFKVEDGEKLKKAHAYAKQKGWPLYKIDKKGRKVYLQGVTSNLEPIYEQPLDTEDIISVRADKLYSGGGLGLSVHGESMTAGVWESIPIRVSHQAFQNRAIQMDGPAFDPDSLSFDTYAHGTGVVGQVIAWEEGANNTNPWISPGPYFILHGRAKGVAPKANVHAYTPFQDRSEVATAALQGLLVSNHSYVVDGSQSKYNVAGWDSIMYAAPYYISVFACGNSGGPVDQLNNGGVAKNALAVANVKDVLNYVDSSSVDIYNESGIPSSRGPADDGRVKPDISAPGATTRIVSTKSDTGYTNASGTSFAAPTVTGAVLLLQQHYNNVNQHFMRSSTVRGLILHTASEAGPNPGPDITFGWGLLNVENAAMAITNSGGKSFVSEDRLLNGGSYSREFVASGSEPLVATICWIDVPGTNRLNNDPTAVLVNDLDSRLAANGTTHYPWKLDWSNGKVSAQGPALQGDNNRDNVEKIEIVNTIPGQTYTLTINNKGSLSSGMQKFSLIVTGLEECVANRNISAPVNGISSDNQQASSSINLTNTIFSGSEALYHAGEEIVMQDGFTAISGSSLRSYVEGCTNDYDARKGVKERAVVTYDIPVKVKEELALPDNAIYPNPGNGVFRVKLAGLSEGNVEVLNQKGVKFFDRKFKNQEEMQVNMKASSSGIYFVRVISEGKVLTKKIVKE
jgi:hypothetical protein